MNKSLLSLTLLLGNTLQASSPSAADGEAYVGFGTDAEFPGYGFYSNPNGNSYTDSTSKVLAAADGKLYLIGRMYTPNGTRLSIERTSASGFPDYDFGDAGLRSYVRPCVDAFPTDAAFDTQGRLWMAVGGCDDYLVYRFLPNGDADASLMGSGMVSIAFNRGGSNEDRAARLLVQPDGAVVVAGWVSTATNTHLGVARFDANGQPDGGFGIGGQVVVPFELDTFFVKGLHRMDDGRLMIDGTIADNNTRKSFVVRLQASGALDIGYGNSSAGISKRDFQGVLGLVNGTVANASWMERDGSLIQVGGASFADTPNSAGDVLLVRWRADGQLDLTVGPYGTRRFALDFAGANPQDPQNNSDGADGILREGNGRYLIATNSYGADGAVGVGLLRLKPNLQLDTSFANGGKIRHVVDISPTTTGGLTSYSFLLRNDRVVAAANIQLSAMGRMHGMLGVQEDLLFADTFN